MAAASFADCQAWVAAFRLPGKRAHGLSGPENAMARMMHCRSYQNSRSSPVAVIDRIDALLQVKRTALDLRAYRQELLASNIANADTPNFKARDIDFKAALAGALSSRTEAVPGLARTSAGHLGSETGGEATQAFGAAVKYRTEFQPSADGNTVNMDVERAAFAENAAQMEAMLAFIRSDLSTLQTAITSQ